MPNRSRYHRVLLVRLRSTLVLLALLTGRVASHGLDPAAVTDLDAALLVAVREGESIQEIQALLDAGADPNAIETTSPLFAGDSPLLTATRSPIDVLYNATFAQPWSEQQTPAEPEAHPPFDEVIEARLRIVAALIDAGADPNYHKPSLDTRTPFENVLDWPSEVDAQTVAMARFLIEGGLALDGATGCDRSTSYRHGAGAVGSRCRSFRNR